MIAQKFVMYNVEYICGLGYGDEGKGRIAAYLATKHDVEDTITVLCSGSSQRGHTMVDENGVRHVFHHFGCATMYGYHSYIDHTFYSNPIMFRKEWEELESKGITPVVYMSRYTNLVLPYHMLADQCYVELRRDADEVVDSSCGCGVWQAKSNTFFEAKSEDGMINNECTTLNTLINRDKFNACMKYFRNRDLFVDRMVRSVDGNANRDILKKYWDIINNNNVWENYWEDLNFMVEHCTLVDNIENIKDAGYNNYIVELSQGLFLDNEYAMDNHITSCNTRPSAYMHFISTLHRNNCRITVNFVTRWYLTRHGFNQNYYGLTMDKEPEFFGINTEIMNETNVYNEWQGDFHYDALSLERIRYVINNERSHFGNNVIIRAFITCFDQVTDKIYISNDDPYDAESYKCLMPFEFLQQFTSSIRSACGRDSKIPQCYVCCGEQPENIIKLRKEMIGDLKQYNGENYLNDIVYTVARGGSGNPIRYTIADDSNALRFYSSADSYNLTTSYDDICNMAVDNRTVPIGNSDTTSMAEAYNILMRACNATIVSNSTDRARFNF